MHLVESRGRYEGVEDTALDNVRLGDLALHEEDDEEDDKENAGSHQLPVDGWQRNDQGFRTSGGRMERVETNRA
jgi:hypothetical protein